MRIAIASLLFWLALWPDLAPGQEFKPYPRAEITREQWQKYLEQVKGKFGKTEFVTPNGDLVLYRDIPNSVNYAFTTKLHPAHPAWITRQIVLTDGTFNVQMIGYFAGEEKEFAILFKQYEKLNERMRKELQKRK